MYTQDDAVMVMTLALCIERDIDASAPRFRVLIEADSIVEDGVESLDRDDMRRVMDANVAALDLLAGVAEA